MEVTITLDIIRCNIPDNPCQLVLLQTGRQSFGGRSVRVNDEASL